MKRMFCALMMLFFGSIPIFASSSKENIDKAGHELLVKYNTELKAMALNIDKYVEEMPIDDVITAREMKVLKNKVEHFNKVQKSDDDRLSFYGLKTKITLNPDYERIIKVATDSSGLEDLSDSKEQEIRAYFTKVTGRDIVVKSSDYFIYFGIILIFGFGIMSFAFEYLDSSSNGEVIFFGFVMFMVGLIGTITVSFLFHLS